MIKNSMVLSLEVALNLQLPKNKYDLQATPAKLD